MKRLATIGAASASFATAILLTLGMGVAAADSISNTGPGSFNEIFANTRTTNRVQNNNFINLSNQNHQIAQTGSAFVSGNTLVSPHIGSICFTCSSHHVVCPKHHRHVGFNNNAFRGSAVTGNASNFNATSAHINVTNEVPVTSQASVSLPSHSGVFNTGPHSSNVVRTSNSSTTTVTNNNTVDINNTNFQTATSGNATVSGNTRGGSATTGDAMNTNSTDFTVDISNN